MQSIITGSLKAATVAALSLAVWGCDIDVHTHRDRYYEDRPVVEHRYVYAYHPDRVVVVAQAPADQVAVVSEAPPPPYAEPVPAPPGPDVIWVGGYWVVSGGGWVWVHGHYDHPPHRGAVWVGGGYERHGDRFEFHAGHWR